MIELRTKACTMLGLTKADLEDLQKGNPKHVELSKPAKKITILYGEDPSAIISHLELLGFELSSSLKDKLNEP